MNDLAKYVQAQINSVLENEIATEVSETMIEHIEKDVYQSYTPYNASGTDYHYHRTYKLRDKSSISKFVANGVLTVKNEAYADDVIRTILTGKGYEWGIVRNLDDEIGARPFIETTVQELQATGRHVDAMKKGLKMRGIDVV